MKGYLDTQMPSTKLVGGGIWHGLRCEMVLRSARLELERGCHDADLGPKHCLLFSGVVADFAWSRGRG
jgi:hypothetical protein